jgi:hypothetical protein
MSRNPVINKVSVEAGCAGGLDRKAAVTLYVTGYADTVHELVTTLLNEDRANLGAFVASGDRAWVRVQGRDPRRSEEPCPECGTHTYSTWGAVPTPEGTFDRMVCGTCEHAEDEPRISPCPGCGGRGPFVFLGRLGNLNHVRCKACGIDSHFEVKED